MGVMFNRVMKHFSVYSKKNNFVHVGVIFRAPHNVRKEAQKRRENKNLVHFYNNFYRSACLALWTFFFPFFFCFL